MANDFYGNMLAANIPLMMGSVYYVDPANGLDTYDGKLPARAFQTLTAGYDALAANNNDMLVLIGNQTSVTKLSATLTWGKNYTHLVGACAPVHVGQRARIFGDAANSSVSPLIDITASGCSFRNIYVNYGVDDSGNLIAVQVTGERNYFENCHFSGINHSGQDVAGACSLKLNGAAECRFVHCSIGSDTQGSRGAVNSEIYVVSRASQMFFEDCYIYASIDDAGHTLIKSGAVAQDLTGTWMFKNCLFQSIFTNNVTAMSNAFYIYSPGTCYIILDHCVGVHINAWGGANGKIYITSMSVDSATDGLAQNL